MYYLLKYCPPPPEIVNYVEYGLDLHTSVTKLVSVTVIFATFCFILVTPIIAVDCSDPSTVHEGDNFRCECKGTNGNPPADVTWYKDNTQIGDTGIENANLSLSNVGIENNGTYRCEAKSSEKAKNETFLDLIVTSKYNFMVVMIYNRMQYLSYLLETDF